MQNLSITQNLNQKLSPQQIQFMKLLQVSSSNIEGIIKKELEANPALEEESNDLSIENESNIDDFKLDQESYKTKSSFNSENKNSEIPFSVGSSLNEKLLDQLSYLKLNEKEQIIAKQIIGTIDEDGYLRRDIESIVDDIAFAENFEAEIKEIENILKLIQSFDPPGIGARNLKECLIIQLNNIERKNQEETIALKIINDFYDDFINKHYDKIISKLSNTNREIIKKGIQIIKNLNPKPGGSMDESQHTEYLIPDFILKKEEGKFYVSLTQNNLPKIKVSKDYISMLDDLKLNKNENENNKKSYDFIKQKLESARWFIDALEQRQNTLINTMNTIIELQYEFFNNSGDNNFIKPMILKDIANIIKMDISTVSRIVSTKVIQTDFGVYQLKDFFSEGHITKNGENISNKKIKKLLQKLINEEDKREPLSDEKLEKLFQEKGYNIARRTISKYREQLKIAVSRLRKEI
tara:strand:- start:872 stop:2269 length:1398 start_codon:yes stop_codon:yes gene_type:complete